MFILGDEESTAIVIHKVFALIQPYDALDLLKTVAALQLCPENADHLVRLDALTHVIACSTHQP